MSDPITDKQSYYKTKPYSPQHITVDMGNQPIKSVGGNLNSRMKLSVTDEAGNVINGFFTKNEYNNRNELFDSLLPPASRRNTEERGKYADYLKKIWDNKILFPDEPSTGSKINSPKAMVRHYVKTFADDEERQKIGNSVRKAVDFFKKTMSQSVEFSIRQGAAIDWMQQNNVIDFFEGLPDEYRNDQGFWNYFSEVIGAAVIADVTFDIQTQTYSQSENSSINKRNNAMYEYASLLGEPNLLAKSSAMTIKQGGQTIHGTFMQSANGIERSDMYTNALQNGKTEIKFSGSAMQQLSKMQVLDYLCGNRDRHYNNWFYQTEDTPTGVKIVGIQGIDNDASFITEGHRGAGISGYMSHLNDIKVMDKGMAQKIMDLKTEKLEEILHLSELSGEEITAANLRLTDLQKRIRSGKIEMIDGAASWDRKYSKDPFFRRLAYDLKPDEENHIQGGANIFQLAQEVSTGYLKKVRDAQEKATAPVKPKAANQKTQKKGPSASSFAQGTSLNTTDDLRLAHLSERLDAFKEKLAQSKDPSLDPVKVQLNNTSAFINKLNAHLAGLKKENKPTVLNDNMRNFLAESLKDLSTQAENYAKNKAADINGKDDMTRGTFDTVKNMAAFSRFSRQSIQRDTAEAEMTDVSRKADILRGKADALWKKAHIKAKISLPDLMAPEYNRLAQKLSSVDKRYIRSSDKFKEMMTSFAALKDAPDKFKAYEDLAAKTQAYLDYKGKDRKPSDYAKSRIAFAKEILEFSKSGKTFEEPNGCREMCNQAINFHNACADVLNKYANSKALLEFQQQEAKQADGNNTALKELANKSVQKAQAALKESKTSVLQFGPEFVSGFMTMMKNSELFKSPNPQNRYLQKLYQSLVTNPNSAILSFANKHAELTDQRNNMPSKTTSPFESMSIPAHFVSDFKENLTTTIDHMSDTKQVKNEVKQVEPRKKQHTLH